MHPDKIFLIVNGRRMSLTAMLAMEKSQITTLDASGCTALTAIDAPEATTLDARGCTALTAIDAPKADYLDARGCTALTAIDAPEATTLYASGCTALTAIDAPKAKIERSGGYIYAGNDSRGYIFEGIAIADQWRVIAGCRDFSIADALAHWGPNGASDRPDCLALVKIIARHAESAS
jgi:hypothetical protein